MGTPALENFAPDEPGEIFGKVMSLPDNVLLSFYVLATNVPRTELAGIEERIERDPMAAKKQLGRTIVAEFWGDDAAERAEAGFERQFQRGEAPAEMPEYRVGDRESLLDVVMAAGLAPSRREARRLFEQGAVTAGGHVLAAESTAMKGTIVKVGKRRWLRLV